MKNKTPYKYKKIIITCLLIDCFLIFFHFSIAPRIKNTILKPVLYLYPETEMNVEVKFAKPELLTTTYPKCIDSWNVKVLPSGDMYDQNGKYYYALYWEELSTNKFNFNEGFYVEKDNAIDFLEEKLSILGLNDKERNEFIMYWLPILEQNQKSLVYFETTESLQKENELIILFKYLLFIDTYLPSLLKITLLYITTGNFIILQKLFPSRSNSLIKFFIISFSFCI